MRGYELRILYFYQYFTTPKGSWSTRAYEMARRWVRAGHQVCVVSSVYDKSDLQPRGLVTRMLIDGVEVRLLNIRLSNRHGFVRRVVTFAAYALLASWFALTAKCDVVLASSGPITVGIPALMAHYVRRKPMVFEVRDLWPEGAVQLGVLRSPLVIGLARWFERVLYNSAATVVALSPDMAKEVLRVAPHATVAVVPNAADLDLFGKVAEARQKNRRSAGKKMALYIGTLGRVDDCGQILDAAAVLKRRNESVIEIVLLGDGAEREALERRARHEGLSNVRFEGLVPKRELPRWLRDATCTIVVFRSLEVLNSCSPNKLFDSLAAGVPVVQNTQGWIRELLEETRCGITVPPGDGEAMAEAIVQLARDEVLREEMGSKARRAAEERFDREVLSQRMMEVLEDAARG